MPTFFDGAQDGGGYLIYITDAYGATPIVLALVCGAYLMNIVDACGATSIVVALVRK